MAASPGFSIATSPPGAISGASSPVKFGRPNSTRKAPTAAQLLDQIRHLEEEGNKLRTDTAGGVGSPSVFAALTDLNISGLDKSEGPKFTSTSPSSLTALVDITSEQKTISDLRLQLEHQRRETEKLSNQLQNDVFSTNTSRPSVHMPGSPSKTGFSTLPSTGLFGGRKAASVTLGADMGHGPPSHLEKSLKDSQEQVADLRRRLMESNELSESQKRQFRITIEDLKAKLHDTTATRDSVLELKQKEVSTLENKVMQYEAAVKEMRNKIVTQEMSLAEASKKADGISRENYISETTLNQVRLILVDAERRRGKPYFDSDPASQQNPSLLVHTLERFVQELMKDVELKINKITELEKELGEIKKSQSSDQQNLSIEHNQKITQMTAEHERQMQAVNERSSNARKQAAQLESQLSIIQSQHDQQMKLKEDTISELEGKIKHLREEVHEEREKYSSKRENLEHTLHDTEKEMSKLRSERDEAIKNQSSMESKIAELQLTINKTSRDLSTEKENSSKFWDRESELRSKQLELQTRLEEKTRDVDRLEKMLASVKQECTASVTEKISMIERQERERHMEKISSLTAQLSEVSEKCNKLSLEVDNTQAENREMRLQTRELTERSDTTKVQYDAAVAERKHLTDMLSAKTSDFERVSQERDYYFNIMDQKNAELSQLKTLKERISVQLEEKEKNITILQEQVNSLQQMMESNSRNCENMREERDVYCKQLLDTTSALEELKSVRDTMAKKMKIREKKIKELESEKQKNTEEIELRNQEMGIIQQEKETLYKELKESRYEVANLTEEKDSLKKELESQKYQLEKTIGKLQYRLKTAEADLALAQKALRKRENVDNSAVKMADKMQKEVTAKRSQVDTLQSKIHWYQDQIDSLIKEKGHLEADKDKLKTSLNKTLVNNQQLTVELDTANSRADELKTHCNKLEASLEKYVALERVLKKIGKDKSALRNATTQAQVEMFEQEMTRMKLAHQLDMKEAVQKAMSKQPTKSETGTPSVQTGPSSVSQSNTGTQSGGTKQVKPEQTAQEDRIAAQKSGENYKELGSELKYLLNEMRSLINTKQDTWKSTPKAKASSEPRIRETRSRPKLKPRALQLSPIENKRKAFTQYRVPPTPSDISYHSDTEVDDRFYHNRSRSSTGHYTLYSPERADTRSKAKKGKHRRSRSAEASFMPQDSVITDSDYKTSDYSPPGMDTETSDFPLSSQHLTSDAESYFSQSEPTLDFSQSEPMLDTVDTDLTASLSLSSPIMESTKDLTPSPPTRQQLPDTHALCKRLEERISSLTKMGDNLKRENKEMADLMKTQGRKLKKVKETEKRLRKPTR